MSTPLLTVAEMRAIEQHADAHGLSFAQMMQNAGRGAAQIVFDKFLGKADKPQRVLILCGPGNNGGDGLVCAAHLRDLASDTSHVVQTYLLRPRADDDPLLQAVRERGIFVADAENDLRGRVLHQLVTHADVIVDALLGTGASRPIDGALKDVLGELRSVRRDSSARDVRVVALDGVTGMNYDTSALDALAVPADLTIAFHAPKRGHFCYPAAGARGELVVQAIGVDDSLAPTPAQVSLSDDVAVRAMLPARHADANKGTFGRALVVGGCEDYVGAPALAATAAYRVGAGLVTLCVPSEIRLACAVLCREATFVDGARVEASDASLANVRAALIGPGMGQADDARERLAAALKFAAAQTLNAIVLDADALNALAPLASGRFANLKNVVVTPHPGEMARLAGASVADVQADRIGNALKFAATWKAVVVLKGAHTVVAAPDGRARVLPFANATLAVAGTGDVLAGAVAGFAAQGLAPFDAAVCGAHVHALAGEMWREANGDAGLLASDLLALLPRAMSNWR